MIRFLKLLSIFGLLIVSLSALPAPAADDDSPPPDKTLPGLMVRYHEPKAAWEIDRVVAVPRLFGNAGDAAHYAMPPTGGIVAWSGLLAVPGDGKFVFTARYNTLDPLSIRLGGKAVTLGQPIELDGGLVPLQIEGTQKSGPIAFELWWRGPSFDDEPIAPRFFRHNAPAPQDPTASAIKLGEQLDHGAILADLYNCFRCHAGPAAWTGSLAEGLAPDRELLPGPQLKDVGSRLQPQWILHRLTAAQPNQGSRMPALFGPSEADRLAARTIAAYLSAGAPAQARPAGDAQHIAHGAQLYKSSGCAACHDAPESAAGDAPLTSPVSPLNGLAAKYTRDGLAAFILHPLKTRPHGRMPDFNLKEADATDLSDYLLSTPKAGAPAVEPPPAVTPAELLQQWHSMGGADDAWTKLSPDKQRTAVSLRLMESRRCFSCHELEAHSALTKTGDAASAWFTSAPQIAVRKPAALVDKRLDEAMAGCLAPSGPPKDVVRFALTDDQRRALVDYVVSLNAHASASAAERLRIDMAVLNCARCHDNEGSGGKSLETLLGGPVAAHYISPPTLTRVGERLRTEQLHQWISQGAGEKAMRPWVGAKMAGFGARGARVAAALALRDGFADRAPNSGAAAPVVNAAHFRVDRVAAGRVLSGVKGLACINCHTVNGHLLAGHEDQTTRGPDLDRVVAHLRPEFFSRWLMNPARIQPGTKMPQTIQRNGRVGVPSLASLPPGEPIDALWSYLTDSVRTDPPNDEPMVLLMPLADSPVVQRGETHTDDHAPVTRGISLGFAGGTLLFDADQLSPVSVWYGGFVRGVAQQYFGIWWEKQGDRAELLPPEFGRLSFKPNGGTSWQDYPSPIHSDPNDGSRMDGYRIGKTGIRLQYRLLLGSRQVSVVEDVRVESRPEWNGFLRRFRISNVEPGAEVSLALPPGAAYDRWTDAGGQLKKIVGKVGSEPTALITLTTSSPGGGRRAARLDSAGANATGAHWQESAGKPAELRIVSNAAEAGKPIEFSLQWWAYRGQSPEPTAADLASLVKQPIRITDEFPAAIKPPVPVPAEPVPPTAVAADSSTSKLPPKPLRPPVNTTLNVDEFPPVLAKFVRMNILATENHEAPGIDEFEIFGADPKKDLAVAGKATASSVIQGYSIHTIPHLNDGIVGNAHSWIGGDETPDAIGSGHWRGWVQIELPAATEVRKITWARDRTGSQRDRLITAYTIEVSSDGHRWTQVIDSSGRTPRDFVVTRPDISPGYRMELIPAPFAGIRPAGIAFGPDRMMYVIAMSEGQIWRSPLPPPGHPDLVHWTRYASGLAHPIGLTFIDGRLFVSQKPEITELIDHEGNGTVDEYRTVASGWNLSTGFHEYTFGLDTDRQKNLYFCLNTGHFWTNPGFVNPGRYRGSVMRIDWPSMRIEEIDKGCRVPNGIVRGPDGDMFFTDNQGDWIQVCKLAHIVPGRFYGHPEDASTRLAPSKYPDGEAAVWLPYDRSRSTSGPAFDDSNGKFGPFSGQFFVGDVGYGGNKGVMRLAIEKVDGEYQGAAFRWSDDEPLGCERMTFGPDGQLYMTSLTTGLTRVRFVGPTPLAIHTCHIRPGGKGFVIEFTKPLAAGTKLDPAAFRVKHYHYLYTGNYGSPNADVTNVPVVAAELSPDRKSATLTFPVLTYPIGMTYEINTGRLTADGGEELVHNDIWYTVNRIPK